jgi:hypothetical protein
MWIDGVLFPSQRGGPRGALEQRQIRTLFPGWSFYLVREEGDVDFTPRAYIERAVRKNEDPAEVRFQGIALVEEVAKHNGAVRRFTDLDATLGK